MKKYAQTFLLATVASASTIGLYKLAGFDKQEVVVQQQLGGGNFSQTSDLKTKAAYATGLDFTLAAEKVNPAVVHILSTLPASASRKQNFGGQEDFFRDFFGDDIFKQMPRGEGQQQQRKPQSSGSGVIIGADGYIVTNNHVIDKAEEIEVILNDKRTYKATLIGTDPATDLALLKVEAKGLPSVAFGNSNNLKVGEWVLAVGNPFNLESTVTAGIVSAKGRNINILKDNYAIESFIQTDAAVNPGNSGGALVNLDGDLVGINTAIATPTGTFAGYSFAVPVDIVKKVTGDLLKFGTVQRGFLGVTISSLNGTIANEKSLSITEGILVDGLSESGSAKEAGIEKGDVIVKIDGRAVKSSPELQEAIGGKSPGDAVVVTVFRDGKEKQITVKLKNKEGNTDAVKPEKEIFRTLGAEFENLTSEEQKKYNINGGVRVKKLGSGKISKYTDIREGFIITKLGGKPVKSMEDFEKQLEGTQGGVLLEGVYPDYKGSYYYAFGLE